MNLEEALKYTENKIALGVKSDGCTLAPDLGIFKWCEMHDMLRVFKPISAWEADKHLFNGIRSEGIKYLPIAIIYWVVVRIIYMLGFSWQK